MKLEIVNISGSKQGEFDIADELLIKNGKGTQALHDAVVAYRANQRLGTAKTKQMGEVNGTGKKPWKQKGTGRARAGSFQSPIWRGGAVVFGPQPRDYSIQVPKKTKALAFRKALSERLLAGDVIVVDDIKLSSHKTKEFAGIVGKLSPVSSTLIVAAEVDANLKKASRNLAGVQVQRADALNVYELLRFEKIVVTRAAAEQIQARLAKS
jgi:large subunit ribosomal protein L4